MKNIIYISFLFFYGCFDSESQNSINLKLNSDATIEKGIDSKFTFYTNYKKSVADGLKYNKKLFIIFYTDYCTWCHKLKREILENSEVQKILTKYYIPIVLHRDEKKSYPTRKYTVSSIPAIYITTSDGETILRKKVGYHNPEQLIRLLNDFK